MSSANLSVGIGSEKIVKVGMQSQPAGRVGFKQSFKTGFNSCRKISRCFSHHTSWLPHTDPTEVIYFDEGETDKL